MTERSVAHGSFCIERSYPASPARVYAAFADPAMKKQWACHDNWQSIEIDVRPGGREISRGGPPGGPVFTFSGVYSDVVPHQRLVFTYEMHRDADRISVSVCTLEFKAQGEGCLLVFTEHGAFFDGLDTPAEREHGSRIGLDNLAAHLTGQLQHAAP